MASFSVYCSPPAPARINGLNYTFKGGMALVLATEKPKRLSINTIT